MINTCIELQTSLVVFLVVWCHSGCLFCIILRKFAEIDLHIKYIKAKNCKHRHRFQASHTTLNNNTLTFGLPFEDEN